MIEPSYINGITIITLGRYGGGKNVDVTNYAERKGRKDGGRTKGRQDRGRRAEEKWVRDAIKEGVR